VSNKGIYCEKLEPSAT